MSVNKVILVGRLGADPESHTFPNGDSICNIRVATSENWKDKQTGESKERTEWHRCALRNKLGDIAQRYLIKGSQVYLEGSIRTKKWQNIDGQDRYSTEIMCEKMTMIGNIVSSNRNEKIIDENVPIPQVVPKIDDKHEGGYDDDIPF